MGKLKDVKFGNKSFKDYEDDFLDDDYHYDKWRRESKNKKRKNQEGYYDDADMD